MGQVGRPDRHAEDFLNGDESVDPRQGMDNVRLERLFPGQSEMAGRMREMNWSETELGRFDQWPAALVSTLSICLASRFPMAIYWGGEGRLLYNDAWRPILGNKHPWAIGRPAREVWPEIWDAIAPLFESVRTTGEGTWRGDELLPMQRFGYTEECYFDYTFNPIRGQSGQVEGILNVVQETTYRVLNERRSGLLRDLASRCGSARSEQEACEMAVTAMATDPLDIPFSMLYAVESNGRQARLVQASGLPAKCPALIGCMDLGSDRSAAGWPLALAFHSRNALMVDDLSERFGMRFSSPWLEPTVRALVQPIAIGTGQIAAILVAGVNPRRALQDDYRQFFDAVAAQIGNAMTNARAYFIEQRRAEALAELDHAKTTFFSNVSHEFRTPLTLMLGPLEELLAVETNPDTRSELQRIHRNSLRLLKLVNTLLEFSRLEAGRVQATYVATDLAAFTAELASVFRSAIEQAGLRFKVDCPPLPEPLYVDRDMWEKIVLNLLSNALKFTFDGEIAVTMTARDAHVELSVRDTGTGISGEELPRIFDRFHRIEGAQGRTHEGTGIGLALVQELVKLHGGTVEVESVSGQGSTFLVCIPRGTAHLPADRIGEASPLEHVRAPGAMAFAEESLRWLPSDTTLEAGVRGPGGPSVTTHQLSATTSSPVARHSAPVTRPRVLLADDNADMRGYVRRLLSAQYHVTAVADGEAALMAARQDPPDLVLTDVMMPRLDGFGLLRALREAEETKQVPVIMLSARAGEEASVEGLNSGADDYLIKPFSARELLAHVGAHLTLARVRREAQIKIAKSQLFLERIAAATPDMLYVFDILEGRNVYINRRLESVLGYSAAYIQSMAGDQTDALFHSDDLAGVKAWHARFDAAGDGEILEHEFRVRHADGSPRWILARATVFERSDDGRAKQIVGIASDITGRKRAEEKSRQFFNLSNALLVEAGFDGRLHRINPAWEKVLGWTVEELTSRPWLDFVHADDLAATVAAGERLGNGFEVINFDNRYRHKDGSYRWIRWNTSPSLDHQMIYGVAEDVTEQKRSEEALRASEERLRLAMQAGEMGAWDVDLMTNEARWDGKEHELCGMPIKESPLSPELFYSLVHPDDRPALLAVVADALERTGGFDHEFRLVRPNGEVRWLAGKGVVVRDKSRRAVRMIGVNYDVTDRKRAAEGLKEWNQVLERSVAERTAELQQSQDRLRALATELNLAEQRERTRLATELHDYLAQMLVLARLKLGQAKRVHGLIPEGADLMAQADDVLGESLAYTRTLVADLSPPVLQEFGLAAALKWLAERMKRHDLAVAVTIEEDQHTLPEEHAVLLFQSARELLMNVSKHARVKEASVMLSGVRASLVLEVRDSGTGFDVEQRMAVAAPQQGTFGLFSIRERMKALGGSFEIESSPENGTRARLTLPLAQSEETKVLRTELSGEAIGTGSKHVSRDMHPALHQQDPSHIRVLLVDDHAMVRQGLRSILESYADIEVIGEASNGEEAVLAAERLRPAIVVMDINMPKMNGVEATARIKSRHPEISIIGLSVNAEGDNQAAMMTAGAAMLLTKEAAAEELYGAIVGQVNVAEGP